MAREQNTKGLAESREVNMKSDAFDTMGATMSYTNTGLNYRTQDETPTNMKIEVLVKALGTMILMPEYEQDPTMIGTKYFKGNVQLPILMDDYRKDALNKLRELINKL